MKKILFVDRDGTIIHEPRDFQIDNLEKLALVDGVIPALLELQKAGYRLVMVSNQDGLGSESFPQENFDLPQRQLLQILNSQGVVFDEILICPHLPKEKCFCRKPNLGLIRHYLGGELDKARSFVIGDRETDLELAKNMGIGGIRFGGASGKDWKTIALELTQSPRRGQALRTTRETTVEVRVALDEPDHVSVHTGIGFFDHMLEQLAKHGGIGIEVKVRGDLHIDEHHTVEDTALGLGQAFRAALGDKVGIGRYGFTLPMDEAEARVSVDLSGRAYFVFEGKFPREAIGGMPTELVSHFFRSFSDALGATLHIEVKGENAHHMVESTFKGLGRTLRQAVALSDRGSLPSTKGSL